MYVYYVNIAHKIAVAVFNKCIYMKNIQQIGLI